MTPYIDAGFLLTLLIRTRGSDSANQILKSVEAPFPLNFLHQLQAENLLVRAQKSEDSDEQRAGVAGQRLWRHYLDEGVFQFRPADWDTAFRLAITWTSQQREQPHAPLLYLHPALGYTAGATHFISFDPRSRAVAKAAGMKLLPVRL